MGLYLVETTFDGEITDKNALETKVSEVKETVGKDGINLIEVQAAKDSSRSFLIFESEKEESALADTLKENGVNVDLIKAVRIVGKDLEEVKKQSDKVNYLVQWNLPEDLTMDDYLARKKKNSVHYAEVPEVSFERTYVCEDMSKCLCFYDAPDEDAVKRAREAVKTPIDSITEISNDK
ncbi:DUF4242 domain-containing protein [Lentibacillus amyloliquefaciens]|uniref:DUF4242 domain-containing protein n=1 Tax=Lentibacillus amyloliquefaciens TaxID=1472767 RepID=A0A0U3W6V8_9BACI|nr:DUF4242 domain-containing protein [Lentibacillus amyloliquefaciens]ALX48928.1 hypothetical protein AOX59_10065 [Lentibacillus amyloliquefaciens]